MDHGIGIGITGIDAERLCQPAAVAGLDRGEAEPPRHIARRDEADPARAEHAHAVIEDYVIVGPLVGHKGISSFLRVFFARTGIPFARQRYAICYQTSEAPPASGRSPVRS